MKNNEYLKLIGYVLITFVVVWILAIISNKCFDIEINSDTAIISFIGIIATFIVIGNFSQVAEMKNQTLEQTNNYNLKIQEFDAKLKEIDTLKEKLEAKEKDIEKLQTEFYESQFRYFSITGGQFFLDSQHNSAYFFLLATLGLLPDYKKKHIYDHPIDLLTRTMAKVEKKYYTKEQSKKISAIIEKAENSNIIDQKLLEELKEEVKKKNIEFGY